MEIKVIQTTAYQVVSPAGNRRCFTPEGAYRALAKRMMKNKYRWQCHCQSGGNDDNSGHWFVCRMHESEEAYVRKINLQARLVRYLKYAYPKDAFTASNTASTQTSAMVSAASKRSSFINKATG